MNLHQLGKFQYADRLVTLSADDENRRYIIFKDMDGIRARAYYTDLSPARVAFEELVQDIVNRMSLSTLDSY